MADCRNIGYPRIRCFIFILPIEIGFLVVYPPVILHSYRTWTIDYSMIYLLKIRCFFKTKCQITGGYVLLRLSLLNPDKLYQNTFK